ncbi:uncharacterized protein BCR38DRAFT_417381 [Pseudomassariella vexata]|uniref:U4/U6.U5 small nuclear ribonucleoprotein 27kDa protein domain-containing protein n=1 Tax=Pseudomassariella vexata TaxID=1141098 RepID=A0A1Y2EJB5_9PEZI|nr:uncharacterized protein BCR38DRAFT_417381 [Pseudomassariella vexata]ORY71557.1 hypothetical protein BCR38DRAFT_417381 [Pseudomassariella vexata]
MFVQPKQDSINRCHINTLIPTTPNTVSKQNNFINCKIMADHPSRRGGRYRDDRGSRRRDTRESDRYDDRRDRHHKSRSASPRRDRRDRHRSRSRDRRDRRPDQDRERPYERERELDQERHSRGSDRRRGSEPEPHRRADRQEAHSSRYRDARDDGIRPSKEIATPTRPAQSPSHNSPLPTRPKDRSRKSTPLSFKVGKNNEEPLREGETDLKVKAERFGEPATHSGGEAMNEDQAEDEDEDEIEIDGGVDMAAMMGFSSFDSTKGKKVKGNDVGAVRKEKKSEYRQYMNRVGGFNRPLSPGR